MLIIEGPDCVGKTTVAKALAPQLELMYSHFGLLPNSWEFPGDHIECASSKLCQDRYHMSEIVYTTKLQRMPRLHPEQYRLIDAYIRTLAGVTVIITCDDCLIEERFRQEHEEFEVADVLRINRAYQTIVNNFGRWWGYDIDYDLHFHCDRHDPFLNEHHLAKIIECYLKRKESVLS